MTKGLTQGPECFELTSVKVGHEPQEGWCLRFATRGNTKLLVIETLWCPPSWVTGKPAPDVKASSNRLGEARERRASVTGARHREREGLEEGTRAPSPCFGRKAGASAGELVRGNPMSAAGMKQAPYGFG
jgi:hypothetical protein